MPPPSNRPINLSRQVDQAFRRQNASDGADFVEHLVEDLRVGGGDLQKQIEAAGGGEGAFDLGDGLEAGDDARLRAGLNRDQN